MKELMKIKLYSNKECSLCGEPVPGSILNKTLRYCSIKCRLEAVRLGKIKDNKIYRKRHKEYISQQKKEYESRPEVKARRKERVAKRLANPVNRANLNNYAKKYYRDNKERLLAYAKEYQRKKKLEAQK